MRYRLEYHIVRALVALAHVMPDWLVYWCGTLLGLLSYSLDGAHRRIAERNLAAAFPVRSAAERRAIARGAFAHFGRLLFELLKFSTLSNEAMLARVEFDGEDRARLAYAQGKGVLFFTGHFGFWELHAIVHPLCSSRRRARARARQPRLHELLENIRQRTGHGHLPQDHPPRHAAGAGGQRRGYLIDPASRAARRFVDFFERPAATTSMVAALALRTGAPVVPVFALPLGGGRYRMIYEHPVEPPRGETEDAIREFTQRCTDVLEMYVRRHPELWLWMHRRWRENETAAEEVAGMFPTADREADGSEEA